MSNPFYRLAPFIQDYIYAQRWGELRPIQVDAIAAILDRNSHILITSGTASGKTEAAFLPILTSLDENPSTSISVIYVGPLKALINDQFYRLEGLLTESNIPVQSWHGDIAQSKKMRFLREGQGILQITPESLEAMLINRSTELGRLFSDLRFIVLDEVHALIDSDRGRQVLCQLQRLARYQKQPPRRIGLSATIGEPELAMHWLAGGTDYPVEHIQDLKGKREVMLGLEHFIYGNDDDPIDDVVDDEIPALSNGADNAIKYDVPDELRQDQTLDLYRHIAGMVETANKTLIFANTRNYAEAVIHNLRRLAKVEETGNDFYHVHHGSISAALREQAEQDMRDPNKPACVAATITLELGIDIGNLDQVLQLKSTYTVSSFVQRLGRSGRRGNPAQMFFYTDEVQPPPEPTLGQLIPWDMLQMIAVIQLYLEEKWIEPPFIPQLPTSLLYHQTMSAIAAQTELTPPELAERVLSLSPFQAVTFDQYRELLRHLLEIDHLVRLEGGGLIIGTSAEPIVNNYRFYATFEDETSYAVRDGSHEIGSIQSLPAVNDRFRLAGRAWQVVDLDEEKRVIYVKRVKGRANAFWDGGSIEVHTRIMQRIRQVLAENNAYGYLGERATTRLELARQLARHSKLITETILPMSDSKFMMLPWQGTRQVATLQLLLAHRGLKVTAPNKSYYLEISDTTQDILKEHIAAIVKNPPPVEQLIVGMKRQTLARAKYDRYVPESLLRASYSVDWLDMSSALAYLQTINEAQH